MRCNIRKKIREQSGSTMAEVIVSFAVLLLLLACFAQVISLAAQVNRRTREKRKTVEDLYTEYYADLQKDGAQTLASPSDLLLTDQKGNTFTLALTLESVGYTDGTVEYFAAMQEGQP